jgi:hypothetical protein
MSKPAIENDPNISTVKGQHAILGVDIVSFSTLQDEEQLAVIKKLMLLIREALAYNGISDDVYRWSPAGDGGDLTFVTDDSCRSAVDVAFSIFEKLSFPARNVSDRFSIRAALHAGIVTEDDDMVRDTNIWGIGINITARILSISKPSQLLVSKQYFDAYMKDQSEGEFSIGKSYWRTVKHGVRVEVMNVSRTGVCLGEDEAIDKQWSHIGNLWYKTAEEYEFLIGDAMRSAEPIAAIAAAKFLLALGGQDRVRELCKMLSRHEPNPECDYPHQSHELFSSMPADVLFGVIERMHPRFVGPGEIICHDGLPAETCFLPVAGSATIEVAGREPTSFEKGTMYGELSLWVPNLIRTATIRATDNGLVLELEHQDFCRILQEHSGVADVVNGLIKMKIIDYVWRTPEIFPGLATEQDGDFSNLSAQCEKFKAGEALDLLSFAYVLLTGRVQVRTFNDKVHEIIGGRRFDRLAVAGIVCEIGMPDGSTADVVEETVAVKIRHDVLIELQKKYPIIEKAWNALCGQRLSEIGFSLGSMPPLAAKASQ